MERNYTIKLSASELSLLEVALSAMYLRAEEERKRCRDILTQCPDESSTDWDGWIVEHWKREKVRANNLAMRLQNAEPDCVE